MSQTNLKHPGYRHVVHLLDNFIHEGPHGTHLCLVLELMRQTVLDLQKIFPNRQLPAQLGRQIAQQTLHALDWLHDSCGNIHTGRLLYRLLLIASNQIFSKDIKPDNLLIENPDINEAVQSYLTEAAQSNTSRGEDNGLISQPLVNNSISESSKINIKIINFGVGKYLLFIHSILGL
jgi:serine/threonine-protein kinase SRPK3